jgi:RNA polymerase sigma factor (sigma-70 family)
MSRGTEWVLQFLTWIDPDDPVAATERYLKVRDRLIAYFHYSGVHDDAEDLADATLDAIAAHIAAGKPIEREKLESFAYQRAKWRLGDYRKQRKRTGNPVPEEASTNPPIQSLLEARQRLEICLQQLSEGDRRLVLEYFSSDYEGAERVKHRKAVAKRLHLNEDALRVRLFRIREKLREFMERSM